MRLSRIAYFSRLLLVFAGLGGGVLVAADVSPDQAAAIEALIGSVETLRNDPAALQEMLKTLNQQAAAARQAIKTAKADGTKAAAALDEKTKQLAAGRAGLDKLNKHLEAAKAELTKLEKALPALTKQAQAAEQKLAATARRSASLALSLKAITALRDPTSLATSLAKSQMPSGAQSAVAIINAHCIECHNEEKAKGRLVLTSRDFLLKGAKDGPVVISGNSADSLLAQALLADADPHMPPKSQLADAQIATLRSWIDAGLAWDDPSATALAAAPIAFRPLPASFHPALALALSVDQKRLAVGRGNRIQIYNLEAEGRPLLGELTGHEDVVQSLTFSPNGKWLASGGYRRVLLWDVASLKQARELTGFVGRVTALAFSPDNQRLFTADGVPSRVGVVRVFSMESGERIKQWNAHTDTIFDLEVSADGQRLASAGGDKTAKVWNLADFTEYAKFEGHTGRVLALAFKPDNKLLATGSEDKDVKVWNLDTKDQKITIKGNTAPVNGLIWTGDGKQVISTGEDRTVRFLTEAKAAPVKNLSGAADVVYAVVADPEGKTVYAACHDGWVYVWGPDNKLQAKIGPAPPEKAPKTIAK